MTPELIGRDSELSALEKEYAQNSSLVLLKGIHGIGKTSLIREFIRGKDALYFSIPGIVSRQQIGSFSDAIGSFYRSPLDRHDGWRNALDAFSGHSDNKKVLVLEDLQNLHRADPDAMKEIRDAWDDMLSQRNVMLILSSSDMPLMDSLENEKSGVLYGRVSRSLELKHIPFASCMTGRGFTHDVERYAITGGNPYAMGLLEGSAIRDDVLDMIGRADVIEGPSDLLDSIKEPHVYTSILSAISSGSSRITEISESTGVPATTLNAYMKKLIELRLIERRVPVTEYFPEKSKNGSYRLLDGYQGFWFRFIAPHSSELSMGERKRFTTRFDADFLEKQVNPMFVEICTSMIRGMASEIGFLPLTIGGYWNRRSRIDIMAMNPSKRRAFVAKCSFRRNGALGRRELDELRSEAERIPELKGFVVKLGLFSVTGFENDLLRDGNVLLVDCGEVVRH